MSAPEKLPPILVVDDNPATLYATTRVLRGTGWEVVQAETGGDALQLAERGVALVVLDVNLPDMDGFEVCRRLRERECTARTPILHVSATAVQDNDRVQGLESGADGYLVRPVEPPVLVATVRSLLRTRLAEEELRRSEAKFKAVFDNSLAGIALLNNDLVCRDVNPALCRMLQCECEKLSGEPISISVPDEHHALIGEISQRLKEGKTWAGMFPLQAADGSRIYLEWNFSRHSLPGVCLAMAMDITDRLQIEQERERLLASERAARESADNANRLKDDFLATLSHELRTPLNAMIGWAQLLRRDNVSAADLAQGLDIIERNARMQARLISDLLDVSRITSGKLQLNLQPVDPVTLIDAALDAAGPLAAAKSIRVVKTITGDGGALIGDAARLEQVIWNLLNNAVKFTQEGGQVEVTLTTRGKEFAIAIADNGRGIAPVLLPHIFERFRQGETASTRDQSGLGLGLAIAKHLTEAHGGTIHATSAGPGHGAVFEVRLPRAAERAPAAALPSSECAERSSTRLRNVRVLIVEDDPDGCELVCRLLTNAGAEVTQVGSVEPALRAVDSFQPDVLVSDIRMAGQNGYDLIRKIRARTDALGNLPAIALTAFARGEDRQQALQAGFGMHLTKPVDRHELIKAVAALARETARR